MAPSQVSGKKMRALLFGVILGIFAVVHSVTSNDVSQDDVYREAATEGYLVDLPDFLSPLSTALPKRPETTEAPQQPSSESENRYMSEGSGDDSYESIKILFPEHGSEHHESTIHSVEHNHSSQQPSTESKESDVSEGSRDAVDKSMKILTPQHGESTTQGGSHTQRPYTETTESMIEGSGEFPIVLQDDGERFTTTQSSTSTETTESMIEGSGEHFTTTESSTSIVPTIESEGSGLGDEEFADEGKISPVSTTQTSSLTRNIAPRRFGIPGLNVPETQVPQTQKDIAASTNTPGWIIIVAFIVGVAALVMLCVAIATRDKWNRPKQASQLETKTNSSNQQRELEMETFLQKDQPKENGEAAEYTVIQLDDLPDQDSSQ